jgi:hypothetical protein
VTEFVRQRAHAADIIRVGHHDEGIGARRAVGERAVHLAFVGVESTQRSLRQPLRSVSTYSLPSGARLSLM